MSARETADADRVVLRVYDEGDWPAVCRIHDAARYQELDAAGVDRRAYLPMADAAEKDEFFVSETLVACLGDSVVGFASWNESYLTWLYVDPAHQRRGIARRLLTEALRRIGSEAWTTCLEGNDAAIALYRQAGFDVVRRRVGELEGYPAVGLRLALPTSRMHDPFEVRRGGNGQRT